MASSSMADNSTSTTELPVQLKLLLQNLHSLVQIKLDNSNYMLWKTQLQTIFRAHEMFDHLTGADPCPPKLLTTSAGSSSPNPAYAAWYIKDEHLKCCLFASISPSLLPQVLTLPTASSIWQALATKFTSMSRSHIQQLKFQLHNLNKGTQSMQAYLDHVKTITDNLAAVSEVISEEDLLLYILKGLPAEYESFKASIITKPVPLSLLQLRSLLISEELHLRLSKAVTLDEHSSAQQLHTARYSSANNSTKGKGRGNNHRGGRGGRGGRNPGRTSNNYNSATPTSSPSYSTHPSPSPSKTYCQICGKPNHIALECWHRFDTTNYFIQKAEPQALAAQLPSPNPADANLDSGANAHVTHDPSHLQTSQAYTGSEAVAVGNGNSLPIHSTGSGDLKRIIAQEIGMEPKVQKLLFRGIEKEDHDCLHMAGVKDNSKILLMEDATTKNENPEEVKASSEISIGGAAVAEVRLEIDNLSEQVSALEAVVNSGTKVDEKDIIYLTEMLMRQLLKLDGIEAQGEGKMQRKMEVRRVQSFVETVDSLKARTSNPFSNTNNAVSVATEWETFDSGVGSLNPPPAPVPASIEVTQDWEQFD